jgi:hypothetical protein
MKMKICYIISFCLYHLLLASCDTEGLNTPDGIQYPLDDSYYELGSDGFSIKNSTVIITGLERFNGKFAYSYAYLENGGYVYGYAYKEGNNNGIYVSKIKNQIVPMILFNDPYGKSLYTGSDLIRQYTIVIVDDPDDDWFYTGPTGGAPWDTGVGTIVVPCYRGVDSNSGQRVYFENGKIKIDWVDLM